jgi:hypothetical protein
MTIDERIQALLASMEEFREQQQITDAAWRASMEGSTCG